MSLLPFLFPAAKLDIDGLYVKVFHLSGWRLRKVPRSDAFLVFSDSTGWMGHGTSKYIKDKSDYRLDDHIREHAPIPPGKAVAFPVKRIPARNLIVTNIFDEQKLTNLEQFQTAFSAALKKNHRLDGWSITLIDPTDDLNYQEMRMAPERVACVIIDSMLRNRKWLTKANIIATNETSVDAYRAIFDRMRDDQWKYVRYAGEPDPGLDY